MDFTALAEQLEVPEAQADIGFDVGFVIDPSKAYPAVIEYIRSVISNEESAEPGFANLLVLAKSVEDKGWRLALDSENIDVGALDANDRRMRYHVLEIARLWLTEALHQSVNGRPMYLRFIQAESWKL